VKGKPLRIFFSGIGGSGMSALAFFMAESGHFVAGSDRAFERNRNHPVLTLLNSKGIPILPQDGSGIDRSYDFVVFSTAVEPDRPEMIRARDLGVPVKSRPEFLAEIISGFKTVAVAGTSGKSTTSGMLAFLMQGLGLSPSFIGGGRVKQFRKETNPGNSVTGDSDILVAEACESDGTLVNYRPEHALVLNIAYDHHGIEETRVMFKTLTRHTKGKVVINADDRNLTALTSGSSVYFSVDMPSHYRATEFTLHPLHSEFSVKGIKFSLSLPGKHNLYNALSCIAMLSEMGIPLPDIAGALEAFSGIERRFDIHLDDGKRLVIDDYAHNPHKISSLMETVKVIREEICYIFQPHGYAPTRMMQREYIDTFSRKLRDSDHLILLPIFYEGGTVKRDISSHDIADGIHARGKSVRVIEERKALIEQAGEHDAYVVFGARDESLADFTRDIADSLRRIHCNR
jgi:UDP-N-acetylmuramate--alanine ligase